MSTQPLTAANRAAVWLISVVGVGLAMSFVVEWAKSAWLISFIAFASLVLIVSTFPGGFFSRSPGGLGPTSFGRLVALVLLALYLVSAVLLTNYGGAALQLGMITLLWSAASLMTWRSLRTEISLGHASLGVALLMMGVAVLLMGVAGLRDGDTLAGVALLLVGVVLLLLSVAGLREGQTLLGVKLLPAVALLLMGVALLRDGDTLAGVTALLLGVAVLLVGGAFLLMEIAVLRDGRTLVWVTLLLGGAFLLMGIAFLRDGDTLPGVSTLLFGVAGLLSGASLLDTWDAKKARHRLDRSIHRLLQRDPDDAPPHSGGE